MNQTQKARFNSLHKKLQELYLATQKELEELGIDWEPLIVSGHRTQAQQDDCVKRKTSKVVWPDSAHNQNPSLAVDIQGVRDGKLVQGKEAEAICKEIAKVLLKIASDSGVAITWGGTFKRVDYPHFELKNEWDAIKRDPKAKLKGATNA